MEDITGFSAQVKKRIVRNKFNQPILTTSVKPTATLMRPAAMPMRPATLMRPAAMPMRPAAMPMRPAAMPMRPAAMPMRPAAMPMRPADMPVQKITVKTLVPEIIPAAAMPLRPASMPLRPAGMPVSPAGMRPNVKMKKTADMPIKADVVETFKFQAPIKSEVIKAQTRSNEIAPAQEIQPKTDKPINKTLLIGGSLAAVAALYFLTKKRKK